MWRAIIDDVSPDFTIYDIINQPWNTYLHESSVFEFNMLGYSQTGLPSLKIEFQEEVYGEIEKIEETNYNFEAESGSGLGSGSGSGSGGSGAPGTIIVQ